MDTRLIRKVWLTGEFVSTSNQQNALPIVGFAKHPSFLSIRFRDNPHPSGGMCCPAINISRATHYHALLLDGKSSIIKNAATHCSHFENPISSFYDILSSFFIFNCALRLSFVLMIALAKYYLEFRWTETLLL
jgi:hypothetical protein